MAFRMKRWISLKASANEGHCSTRSHSSGIRIEVTVAQSKPRPLKAGGVWLTLESETLVAAGLF
jgi:hypothetical protein